MPFGQIARGLDRRAESRLSMISKIYESGLTGQVEKRSHNKLNAVLSFKDNKYLKEIDLYYTMQNRFFNRNYDLHLEATFPGPTKYEGEDISDTEIELNYIGTLHVKEVVFELKKGDSFGENVLKLLNHNEIRSAFLTLDLPSFKLHYDKYSKDENNWSIKATSLIGSTTWLFMPPIYHTIKPKPEECKLLIDLFTLTARAVNTC